MRPLPLAYVDQDSSLVQLFVVTVRRWYRPTCFYKYVRFLVAVWCYLVDVILQLGDHYIYSNVEN